MPLPRPTAITSCSSRVFIRKSTPGGRRGSSRPCSLGKPGASFWATDKEPVSLLARTLGLRPAPTKRTGRDGPGRVSAPNLLRRRSVPGTEQPSVSVPTVVALEDLHWSDPTSLRLATGDIATLAARRPVVVAVYPPARARPGRGRARGWSGSPTRPGRFGCCSWPRSSDRPDAQPGRFPPRGADAYAEVLEVACEGGREPPAS